jgi:membrane protease YdiL (CAAX protease family)
MKRIKDLPVISKIFVAAVSTVRETTKVVTTTNTIERFSLLAFLLLTPLISLAIPAFLSLPSEVVPLILVFIPAILAILLTAMTEGGKGVGVLWKKLTPLRIDFKWYLIAFGLALGSRFAISVLAILFGWTTTFHLYDWTPLQYVIIGVFTIIGALMEELGWRGYVLPKLLERRSALASALIVGIPWGILHLGLTFPGQMNAGTSWVSTILFILGISVILTWLFIQTKYGIVAGIVFHAAQNFFVFLNGGMLAAGIFWESWLLTAVTLAMAVTLIVVYGPGLQRGSVKVAPMVNAEPLETK